MQHYVPQFYLRRFTREGKTVHVLNKPDLRTFCANVEKIAGENGFYNLPTEGSEALGVDPQIAEKTLSELELSFDRVVGTVLEKAENEKPMVLDAGLREILAHFLIIQALRTRENRTMMSQMVEQTGEFFVRNYPQTKTSGIELETKEQWVALFQIGLLFNPDMLQTLMPPLLDHIWVLGKVAGPDVLYTSDHPFVRRAHCHDQDRSTLGLASPGIELACPLSSSYVLILFDREAFRENEGLDNKVMELKTENVIYYNSLQVSQSYRQVYCSTAGFQLALEMCRDRPHVRDLDRKRVIVG